MTTNIQKDKIENRDNLEKTGKDKSFSRILITIFAILLFVSVGYYLNKYLKSDNVTVTPEPQDLSLEEITTLSEKYCTNRKSIIWHYPLIKFDNGTATTDIKNSKLGSKLTKEDCKNTVDVLNKIYSKEEVVNIVDQKYWIGMESMQVMYSVGIPNDVNTTATKNLEQKQWVYTDGGFNFMFIYTENDKVTAWQD